jgi:hypothetical protein
MHYIKQIFPLYVEVIVISVPNNKSQLGATEGGIVLFVWAILLTLLIFLG